MRKEHTVKFWKSLTRRAVPLLLAVPDKWPQLLALCAVALALCALSAAACGVGKIRRGLFFLLCGGAWSIIAAADCCTPSALPALLLFAAAAVLLLSCALRAAKGGDTP